MTFYALTDSDWRWDDQHEGRAIIVEAETPEEAVRKATEIEQKTEPSDEGTGWGVTWKVAELSKTIGFQIVTVENGVPVFDEYQSMETSE